MLNSAFAPGQSFRPRPADPQEVKRQAFVRARLVLGLALFALALTVQWQLSDLSLYLYGTPVTLNGAGSALPGATVEEWCRGMFADARAGTFIADANGSVPAQYCEGRLVAFVPYATTLGEAPRTAHLIVFGVLAALLLAGATWLQGREFKQLGLDVIHHPRVANATLGIGAASMLVVVVVQVATQMNGSTLGVLLLGVGMLVAGAGLLAVPIGLVLIIRRVWRDSRG